MKLRLFIGLLSLFMLLSCGEKHIQLNEESIEKVELVWVAHHYHNPSVDYYVLKSEDLHQFIEVFNSAGSLTPPVDYTCFEIMIYFKDGTEENYITNGEMMCRVRTGEYFAFNTGYNVITHFWGIPEKDFCVKSH